MNARKLKTLEERIVRLIDPLVEEGYVLMNGRSVREARDPEGVLPISPASMYLDGPKALCGCLLGMARFAVEGHRSWSDSVGYIEGGGAALGLTREEAGNLEAGFEDSGLGHDKTLFDLGRRIAERYGLL